MGPALYYPASSFLKRLLCQRQMAGILAYDKCQSRLAPGPLPNENPATCKRQKGQNMKVTQREAKKIGKQVD